MTRTSHVTAAAFAASLAAATFLPAARAQPTVTVGRPPYYQPGAGPQLGGAPYAGLGFTIYPPGSATLPPQLINPGYNPYPPGAQTCVAGPYTCPADAPNTVGDACSCPTAGGGSVGGAVH